MVIIGTINGVVDICVSITPDQWETVQAMYPDHLLFGRIGDEDIGWLFDGVSFIPPVG